MSKPTATTSRFQTAAAKPTPMPDNALGRFLTSLNTELQKSGLRLGMNSKVPQEIGLFARTSFSVLGGQAAKNFTMTARPSGQDDHLVIGITGDNGTLRSSNNQPIASFVSFLQQAPRIRTVPATARVSAFEGYGSGSNNFGTPTAPRGGMF